MHSCADNPIKVSWVTAAAWTHIWVHVPDIILSAFWAMNLHLHGCQIFPCSYSVPKDKNRTACIGMHTTPSLVQISAGLKRYYQQIFAITVYDILLGDSVCAKLLFLIVFLTPGQHSLQLGYILKRTITIVDALIAVVALSSSGGKVSGVNTYHSTTREKSFRISFFNCNTHYVIYLITCRLL